MTEQQVWKQERPTWCPKMDCQFKRRAVDAFCAGILANPEPHADNYNHYRICFHCMDDGHLDYFLVNDSDLNWLRWVFDALDGRQTSFKGTTKEE